ncbi:unnamed protein product, partial [Bubo scandiacus]
MEAGGLNPLQDPTDPMTSNDFDILIEVMLEVLYKKEEAQRGPSKVQMETPMVQLAEEMSKEAKKESGRSSRKKRSQSWSRDHRHSCSWDRDRDHCCRSWTQECWSCRRNRSRECQREERAWRCFGHSKSLLYQEQSPMQEPLVKLSPEEWDACTVCCMQVATCIQPRDLKNFFLAIGKVRDVHINLDRNSWHSRAMAYVEFCEIQLMSLAISLTSQRILGIPIIIQAFQEEKNRWAAMANNLQMGSGGPMCLYVGSLHCSITKEMLCSIFEPFGEINSIVLMWDPDISQSKSYRFIMFTEAECAWWALEQLNGFKLASCPMRVGQVTEHLDGTTDITFPKGSEEVELVGAIRCLQLMDKLAEGSELQLPSMAQAALQLHEALPLGTLNPSTLT